jgi:hypothetical protein
VIFTTLTGCIAQPTTATNANTPQPKVETTPAPTKTKVFFPPTWTLTPLPPVKTLAPTRTPQPTADYHATMLAQTVIAQGIRCKRHPDAWQVFSGPIDAYAGWCQIVGTVGTLYEYKMLSPDGWMVNTFGELTPNLVFSTGYNNVQVKVFEAYSYFYRSYDGTLKDAPEKASVCDENDHCYGFIDPVETLVRQEVKTIYNREVLVLDSTAGALQIRRYYQIIPFQVGDHISKRLFIVEISALDTALTPAEYDHLTTKVEMMVGSIGKR